MPKVSTSSSAVVLHVLVVGLAALAAAPPAQAQEGSAPEEEARAAPEGSMGRAPAAGSTTPAPVPPPQSGEVEPAVTDDQPPPADEAPGASTGAETDGVVEPPPEPTEAEPEPIPGDEPVDAAAEEEEEERHYGHRFQGAISLLAGTGYYYEIPYANHQCTQMEDGEPTAASNCQGLAPVYMDFQAGFGVTEGLEVLVEFRLGLIEQHLQTARDGVEGAADIASQAPTRPMAFGVGLRYYVDPLNWFKFFVGAMIDIDFTAGLDTEVTVRPLFGVHFDFCRYSGFFIQASPTIYFIRTFRIAIEGGAGLQFRFP